jgi:CubicO group peptidase (beta-lactamase class C family)
LLTHTSGLRDQWGLLGLQGFGPGQEVHTFARILDLVAHQRQLNFKPGAEYLYSNTGYVLAAIIVQRVSGKPFAEFSREELFEPLGMKRTEWRWDYRRVVPDRATAYSRGPGGAWLQDMPFTMVHGNGGLLTTVGDLLTWNDALTKGTLPGGAELVRTLETKGRLNDGTEIGYALGLGVGAFRGTRAVTHGGATAGYRTYLARWPERNLSVAVLCNAGQADAGGYANQIAVKLLGLPASEPSPGTVVALGGAELAALAGSYRDSTTDQTFTFAVSNDRLTVSGGGPAATLTHLGSHRFWHGAAGEFQFERSGDSWAVVRNADGASRFRPEPRVDPATVKLADYVGRYRSPELEVTYDVALESGSLVLRSRPDTRLRLSPIYPDGFAVGPGRTVRFSRGGKGAVTGLRIFAGRVRDVRFERLPDPKR